MKFRCGFGCSLIGFATISLITAGCSQDPGPAATSPAATPQLLADKPLTPSQDRLLDLAFDTATAIPVNPHIKDRSKAQEAVVAACLELDQPARALAYIERIDDWRKGYCYADLAFHCARNGMESLAPPFLEKARVISGTTEDWRRDRIRARIAQTHALLGEGELAEQFQAGAVESETGKVVAVEAMQATPESFDARMQSIDALIAPGSFDLLQNALDACALLYDTFHADPSLRDRAEEKIRNSWDKLPVMLRIDLLEELSRSSIEHGDFTKASGVADEVRAIVDAHQWPVEYHVPVLARIAELRHGAGDGARARAEADAALSVYHQQRDSIVDIWRAGALRPLAEAFHAIGDTSASLSVYRLAVEESVGNPNSRPRAEDLAASCISMATHAVEPDAPLGERIRKIREGLGEPW